MCGICGFTGDGNQAVLKQMAGIITHRGPDDEGFYESGSINLAMRRLAIIDIDSGKQPVFNEQKNIAAVFNGEIYNHAELRKNLEAKGHRFYTDHSDSEVITHLYEEYGLNFPNYLNGMFAIALWDEKKSCLILIRDRAGVKPLFYAEADGKLIFASEIKSILAHPSIKKEMCQEAVAHFFSFKHIPAPLTAFAGIYSLKPAQVLMFDKNSKLKQEKYWKQDYSKEGDFNGTEEEAGDELYKIIEDATAIRMRSDVPVGAYLSGGVDSSLIVALMARLTTGNNVKTFSLGYEDEIAGKSDDVRFGLMVSDMYKTEHHQYSMKADEAIDGTTAAIHAFDQPFGGVISTYFLSKLISKYVKVAISGDGSDELFGSYLSHRLAPAMSAWGSGARGNHSRLCLFHGNTGFLKELQSYSNGDPALWRCRIMPFGKHGKNNIFADGFRYGSGGDAGTKKMMQQYLSECSSKEPLNQMLELEYNSFFPDQVLAFVDFLSMAHSVEVRSPFLDYRLVEFAATLPSSIKIKGDIVKHILKVAVDKADVLPKGITTRPKEGFVLPIYRWMDGSLKKWVLDVLSEENITRSAVLNPASVKQLLANHYEHGIKQHAEIWNMVTFQLWWDEYFG